MRVRTSTREAKYLLAGGDPFYELLTGLRPIDAKAAAQGSRLLTEMIRIVREEEPSKPSTRLSTAEAPASLAALRQTEPRKLMALLARRTRLGGNEMSGETAWSRRYETANALGRDVQRYLADELVEARPPSVGYRLSCKILQTEYRRALGAGCQFAVAGVAGRHRGDDVRLDPGGAGANRRHPTRRGRTAGQTGCPGQRTTGQGPAGAGGRSPKAEGRAAEDAGP